MDGYFKIIEEMLQYSTDELFNERINKLFLLIIGEFSKYYDNDYTTSITYIDFILGLSVRNRKFQRQFIEKNECFLSMIKKMDDWLIEHKIVSNTTKLFRYFNILIDKEKSALISLINKSSELRRRKLEMLKRSRANGIIEEKDKDEFLNIGQYIEVFRYVYSYVSETDKKWIKVKIIDLCYSGVKLRTDRGMELWKERNQSKMRPIQSNSADIINEELLNEEHELLFKIYPLIKS